MLGTGIIRALLHATERLDLQASRVAGHLADTVGGDRIGAKAVEATARAYAATDRANAAQLERSTGSSGPPGKEVAKEFAPPEGRRGYSAEPNAVNKVKRCSATLAPVTPCLRTRTSSVCKRWQRHRVSNSPLPTSVVSTTSS